MKNRMSSTIITISVLALIITLGTAVQAVAAENANLTITTELGSAVQPVTDGVWTEADNGKMMYLKDGKPLCSVWAYVQNREVKEGQPLFGKYLFGEDGVMLTGWQQVNSIWYYLNEASVGHVGACVDGAVKDAEKKQAVSNTCSESDDEAAGVVSSTKNAAASAEASAAENPAPMAPAAASEWEGDETAYLEFVLEAADAPYLPEPVEPAED